MSEEHSGSKRPGNPAGMGRLLTQSGRAGGTNKERIIPPHREGMTPMEAWSVISGNLEHLYRMRKTTCYKGYVPADTEAEVIAFKALQEMQERMRPKPLKFEDVLPLLDQPIWVEFVDAPELNCWGIVESVCEIGNKHYLYLQGRMGGIDWNKNVRVYRHKPEEVCENA